MVCWLPKEVGMFARVTVVEVPPGQFDKARQLLNTAAERTRGLPRTPRQLLAWRPQDGEGVDGCAVQHPGGASGKR